MRGKKVLSGLLFLMILPFELSRGQASQNKTAPLFSVVISAPHAEVKAGSELVVKIALRNLTDKGYLADLDKGNRGECDYAIRVLDKDGKEPPETRYFRAVRGEDTFDPVSKTVLTINLSKPTRSIEPRATVVHTMDLNQLYVLKPGKYTVKVGLGPFRDPDQAMWKSNEITVSVTP